MTRPRPQYDPDMRMGATLEDFAAELSKRAPNEGGNGGLWPGLTIYRFDKPTEPQWEEVQSLSLCIIGQGRKAVTDDGTRYVHDSLSYMVISSHLQFESEVVEASKRQPFLSLVLQIAPDLVRKVSAEMLGRRGSADTAKKSQGDRDSWVMSAVDDEFMSSVLRFLRSLSVPADRRVLAPLYLEELVYRVLQREQFARVLRIAGHQAAANPVAVALNYIADHLAEPLTVTALAEKVSLSPSAFSHQFRDVTGQSPYQFVKTMRLDRARELLIEERLSVEGLASAVGYASTSHFIKQFRARSGTTPGDYADTHSLSRELREAHLAVD